MPGIGMLIYSAYIYRLSGHWLQWAAQHSAWGRHYKGVFALAIERWDYISANGFYSYVTAMTIDGINLLPGVLAIATVIPVWRRFGVEYAALVLITVMVPLLAGGTLSLGRITSVLFPSFLWLSAALRPSQRTAWLVAFALLQTVLAVAFFTWRPLY